MTKCIMIIGKQNTGKTNTCKSICKRIDRKGVEIKRGPGTNDFRVIYELDGKFYAISTMGDDKKSVERGVKMIEEWMKKFEIKLDYLILTSRLKNNKSYEAAITAGRKYDKEPTIFKTNKMKDPSDIEEENARFLNEVINGANLPL